MKGFDIEARMAVSVMGSLPSLATQLLALVGLIYVAIGVVSYVRLLLSLFVLSGRPVRMIRNYPMIGLFID